MNFTKLQALGNDFVVVAEEETAGGGDLGRLARLVCDRHFGAGADGLVVVSARVGDAAADFGSRIFNADGGEAEVSGNGTRCLAAYLDAARRWPEGRDTVRIATAAGVKTVRLSSRGGRRRLLEMEMGAPRFASPDVPMAIEPARERVVDYPVEVDGREYRVTALSVGNPHCTLLLGALDEVDVGSVGPRLERHPLFPERTNVEFVEVAARDRIRARFWERGAGETLSSGTGASAAAVAAALSGLAGRSVTVETAAGELGVTWRESDGVVVVSGPAEIVYEGRWLGAL